MGNKPTEQLLTEALAGLLFDFGAFLTTRKEVVPLGSSADAAPMVRLIEQFASSRNLSLDSANVEGWRNTIDTLRAQLAAVTAERDAFRANAERYHFLAGFGVTAHSTRWAHWRIERWTKNGWEPLHGNLLNAAIDAAKDNK